METVQKLINN